MKIDTKELDKINKKVEDLENWEINSIKQWETSSGKMMITLRLEEKDMKLKEVSNDKRKRKPSRPSPKRPLKPQPEFTKPNKKAKKSMNDLGITYPDDDDSEIVIE